MIASMDSALISPMFLAVLVLFVAPVVLLLLLGYGRDRWRASRKIVSLGVEYANNHHVPGAGYFHATSGKWHRYVWNQFTDGVGFYWDGEWHSEPDQRMVATAIPNVAEIERVNALWRNYDPSSTVTYTSGGFGTALRRHEGR